MFQRDLAKLTADHLRAHVNDYLATVNARYDKPVGLFVPKRIEPASMAGGVFAAPADQLPFYGVDCITKQYGQRTDNVWCWQYNGHIAGLISANNRENADAIVKGHEAAVEAFVMDHQYLHQPQGFEFSILEFGLLSVTFSGAEPQFIEEDKEIWIAGFEITTFWDTSEAGPGQHA
jgi:hypothetical protein